MAKEIKLPIGIVLREPESSFLPEGQKHFLLYIPWDDQYFQNIPKNYQKYFLDCLPQLKTRTTDVHVAICFSFFEELIAAYEKEAGTSIDREVVALSFILHDIGWSRLGENEIAASLGIKGLALNSAALTPKEKHVIEGEKIAREKLEKWGIPKEKHELICACVRWHDFPEKVSADGSMKPEIKVLVDLDHLWSFTKENFWQDTLRKDVAPRQYAENLGHDLPRYFVTETGKNLAKKLLAEREKELPLIA